MIFTGSSVEINESPLQKAAQITHMSKSGFQPHKLFTDINTEYDIGLTVLWDTEKS